MSQQQQQQTRQRRRRQQQEQQQQDEGMSRISSDDDDYNNPHRSNDTTTSNRTQSDNTDTNNTTSRSKLPIVFDIVALLCIVIGIIRFTSSFFLAKKSMAAYQSECYEGIILLQKELNITGTEINQLIQQGIILNSSSTNNVTNDACWMERYIDSLVFVVVDALRFDFAYYNLPKSIGTRLHPNNNNNQNQQQQQQQQEEANNTTLSSTTTSSRLYQFVADPPTVTMQRLKALTTGGLPTFADISSNFGGAALDEDTWISQLIQGYTNSNNNNNTDNNSTTPVEAEVRLHGFSSNKNKKMTTKKKGNVAFVGDDTWLDLFPNVFTEGYPYPSFNTRDLDTVDNGCFHHIPHLLQKLRRKSNSSSDDNNDTDDSNLDVVIIHFLGVDHVGHTYGPHNEHMDTKLRQMDDALVNIFNTVDQSDGCHAVHVLGDHGMTPDGNHGGGTAEEINAALFVYTSAGCHSSFDDGTTNFLELHQSSVSSYIGNNPFIVPQNRLLLPNEWNVPNPEHFMMIHQIDLVPTIAILLGLPIPYANIGSLVPSILPLRKRTTGNKTSTATVDPRAIVAALALNAAQVWRYYIEYSMTSNQLPNLPLLHSKLLMASSSWKDALQQDRIDDTTSNVDMTTTTFDKYMESASLFKLFLAEALELGQKVWTRFDIEGMILGISLQGLGLLLFVLPLLLLHVTKHNTTVSTFAINTAVPTQFVRSVFHWVQQVFIPYHPYQYLEMYLSIVMILFQCGMVTFSNSYILEEDHSSMFGITIISTAVSFRILHLFLQNIKNGTTTSVSMSGNTMNTVQILFWKLPLWCCIILLPICSRIQELLVSGHGLDPSIRNTVHIVHNEYIFILSGGWLIFLRLYNFITSNKKNISRISLTDTILDCASLLFLILSWYEKRTIDRKRNGYLFCQISILFLITGIITMIIHSILQYWENRPIEPKGSSGSIFIVMTTKILIGIMVFTGPSTATTMALYTFQAYVIYKVILVIRETSINKSFNYPNIILSPFVVAVLWKLITRHTFFVTNHGCFFNRLQYSSAFVASTEFDFVTGGIALATNTFGWEVVGFIYIYYLNNQLLRQDEEPISKDHDTDNKPSSLRHPPLDSLWRMYCTFQYLEALCSCISVSVLRRHLMVWDIYAPHFLFLMCFTVLYLSFQALLIIGNIFQPTKRQVG